MIHILYLFDEALEETFSEETYDNQVHMITMVKKNCSKMAASFEAANGNKF